MKPASPTSSQPLTLPSSTRPEFDPIKLYNSMAEVSQTSAALIANFLKRQQMLATKLEFDELGLAQAFMNFSAKMLANPYQLAITQMNMMWDYMALWQTSVMKLWGHAVQPIVRPSENDRRFKHEDWEQHFLFNYVKQSYLIAARHIHEAISNVEGLPEEVSKKVAFYTRQYIDALSPSNFILTNPEVLRETILSGGKNLVKGLQNLLQDLEKGDGKLRIRMTDTSAFELGKNVATTPGKVIYQNELMQLIQYTPSTKEAFKRPLLIIPPWINKYYILDLRDKNSFVKWAVDQGHTVFIISWVNPDEKLAHKTFEHYLLEGTLAAIHAIEDATGEKQINAIGYCLGGTLLGCTLAYMAAKNDTRIASATFFASLLDFNEPGELDVFVDEQQIAALEKRMAERGFLEGSEMATTFNMLRSNDLIWSFAINNYLLGRDPFPFDLLYWNSDSTRMPAKMHSFYLRNMYLKNLVAKPGGITLDNVPIDLKKARVPIYFISTLEDHIAPWKSTYVGTQLFSGPIRFVLGGSGHIAGIINPPSANKYSHWTNEKLEPSADAWLENAQQHSGSWWPDWQNWINSLSKEARVPARQPGDGKLKPIEDAPGSYVKVRLDVKK